MPDGQGTDWRALLSLLPLAVAGAKGGGPAMGGFSRGYSQALALREEEQQRQRAQANYEARQAWEQQQDLAAQGRYDAQQKRQESQQVLQALSSMPDLLSRIAESSVEAGVAQPEVYAQRNLDEQIAALAQIVPGLSVHADALRRAAGDPAVAVQSARSKKYLPVYQRMTQNLAGQSDYDALMQSPARLPMGLTFSDLASFIAPMDRWVPGSAKPATAGSFEDYVTRTYGQNPTPDQILTARRVYQQADDKNDPLARELAALRIQEMKRKRDVSIQDLSPAQQRLVNTLSGQYERASKDYFTQVEQFAKIKSISNSPSPTAADDISFIFAYMKMLDPTSVVREGEFANAQNATGVPDRVRNLYNQVMKGNRLNPEQRKAFTDTSRRVYQGSKRVHDQLMEAYRGKASRQNVPLDLIVYDLDPESMVESPEGAGIPDGAPVVFPDKTIGTWDAKTGRAIKGARR